MSSATLLCQTDPDLFFSDDLTDIELAKAACSTCPLVEACSERGKGEQHGVWGGLTPQERRKREPVAMREGLLADSNASHALDKAICEAAGDPVPTMVTPCRDPQCDRAARELGLLCPSCVVSRRTASVNRNAEVVALLDQGLTRKEVAQKMGLSKATVDGIAHRLRPGDPRPAPAPKPARPKRVAVVQRCVTEKCRRAIRKGYDRCRNCLRMTRAGRLYEVAEKVRSLRDRECLTYRQISARLGISPVTVGRVLRGEIGKGEEET